MTDTLSAGEEALLMKQLQNLSHKFQNTVGKWLPEAESVGSESESL